MILTDGIVWISCTCRDSSQLLIIRALLELRQHASQYSLHVGASYLCGLQISLFSCASCSVIVKYVSFGHWPGSQTDGERRRWRGDIVCWNPWFTRLLPPVVQEPMVPVVDVNNSHGANICREDQFQCSLMIYKLFRKTLLLHSFLNGCKYHFASHINVPSCKSSHIELY